MGWVKFENTGRSIRPILSVRGESQIGFNDAAIKKFKVNEYKYASIFFDEDKKRIGVKLTNDNSERGLFKVRFKEGSGAHIPAKSFITNYKLNALKRPRRFSAEWDSADKMIVAEIKEK